MPANILDGIAQQLMPCIIDLNVAPVRHARKHDRVRAGLKHFGKPRFGCGTQTLGALTLADVHRADDGALLAADVDHLSRQQDIRLLARAVSQPGFKIAHGSLALQLAGKVLTLSVLNPHAQLARAFAQRFSAQVAKLILPGMVHLDVDTIGQARNHDRIRAGAEQLGGALFGRILPQHRQFDQCEVYCGAVQYRHTFEFDHGAGKLNIDDLAAVRAHLGFDGGDFLPGGKLPPQFIAHSGINPDPKFERTFPDHLRARVTEHRLHRPIHAQIDAVCQPGDRHRLRTGLNQFFEARLGLLQAALRRLARGYVGKHPEHAVPAGVLKWLPRKQNVRRAAVGPARQPFALVHARMQMQQFPQAMSLFVRSPGFHFAQGLPQDLIPGEPEKREPGIVDFEVARLRAELVDCRGHRIAIKNFRQQRAHAPGGHEQWRRCTRAFGSSF